MLARKLKCPSCGGNKINEVITGYIYCDYCSTLMGYDMENMTNEAAQIFSIKNYTKPLQKSFIKASQELGQALKENDKSAFVNAQLKIHEIEFELFPKRFGPKAKQPAYRKKFLSFYKKYWNEKVESGYIETAKNISSKFGVLSQKLKTEIIDGKVSYETNNDFIQYIDAISDYTKVSIVDSMKMESMSHYPEPITPATPDLMYKQGINGFIQQFEANTAKKVIEHLGLQSEYIEINAVPITEMDCMVCKSTLKIPESSESIVCETCGNINKVKNKEIQCLNCSAPFEANEKNECPYCRSKMIAIGKERTTKIVTSETKNTEAKQKTSGFFGKLFSKK